MNWKELKDFCNSIPASKLENKVILWQEGESISKIEAEKLKEDHYMHENDEGCYPLSEAGISIEEVEEKDLKKVYDKGDPILWEVL